MLQRVVRIAPVQAGKVFAILYGIISLVFTPFFMLPALLGAKNGPPTWLMLLFIPIHVILGFVGTAVVAWLYNIVAGWVGGIEITVESESVK